MRLTVGPLPAAVYWRRRAAVATVLALVIILFVTMCHGPDTSTPNGGPTASGSPRPGASAPASGSTGTGSPAPSGSASANGGGTGGGTGDGNGGGTGGDDGVDDGTGGGGGGGGSDGGGKGPPVVATVPCGDAEMAVTVGVSPSPGIYGGVITLTLIVRNTADHACYRDVGSAPQELQVRQGTTTVWSSDHCDTPQASDVRAFGPNIETQFPRRWNTYRIAPDECDPPVGALPAAPGTYQVVARLGGILSAPVTFEIQK